MSNKTKLCPFCREEIKVDAIRCKHCQAMLAEPPPGTPLPPGTQPGQTRPTWSRDGAHIPEGTEVREYRIVRLLGEGGMGEVYLAEHTYTGQKVAIKAVNPMLMRDLNVRRRFLEEGRVMASLDHPNIVTLHAFFEEGGRFFLVMQYVEGETLEALLERERKAGRKLAVDRVLDLAQGILEGMAYAHAHAAPVVHRDIKPANILLDKTGRPVITDFGIAKAMGREKLTQTLGVVGTCEYMSPEQVTGAPVTPASDVYSAGIMFYRMLSGQVPFPQTSDTGIEVMDGHRHGQPPALGTLRPDCPERVVQWVEQALAKAPEERHRDGGLMLAGLSASGPRRSTPAASDPDPEVASAPPGRGRMGLFIAIGLVALLAVALAVVKMGGAGGETTKGSDADKFATAPVATACVPSCAEKQCGEDGCGGNCGICRSPELCKDGTCVCTRQCTGKQCGDDGCGGLCGDCQAGHGCEKGLCVCVPDCSGSRCDDGCGRTCERCKDMVRIAAGSFMMGCNEAVDSECEEDEKPYHEVTLDVYWMDRHEVMVEEYARCLDAGACEGKDHKTKSDQKYCNQGHGDRADHPMNCVDWYGADAYCRWVGKRLPTEAEWERAARGTDGRKYPWGNERASCEYAVMDDGGNGCGRNSTWPVCSKEKGNSPDGLCDMAGNVWEWVSDWYGKGYYAVSPSKDPQGPETVAARVVRGGSQGGSTRRVRASDRGRFVPGNGKGGVGFRCVCPSAQ